MGFLKSFHAVAAATLFVGAIAVPRVGAQAVIRGVLYDDSTGTPLRGTVMLVDPATDAPVIHTPTDSVGVFELKAQDGVYQIAAVREGYTSVLSAPVSLHNGERITIRVPIASSGDPHHQIGVVEHIRPQAGSLRSASGGLLDQTGYNSRKSSGLGLHYDQRDFKRSNYNTLGEFLQSVPGFAVGNPSSTSSMRTTRSMAGAMADLASAGSSVGACHVGWFVDGYRTDIPGRSDPLTDGLGLMDLRTIAAVEVFRGVSEMPAQFAAPDLSCGAVAIWTTRGQ
jgi:hypothetical protein